MNTPPPLSHATLCEHIKETADLIADWEEAPLEEFEGGVKVLSRAIENAWSILRDLIGTDHIEADARSLVLVCDDFFEIYDGYQETEAKRQPGSQPGDMQATWDAWSRIMGSRAKPVPAKSIETVAELNAQKVPPQTIARIYGWFDHSGQPDTGKVAEEVAQPGTHVIGPTPNRHAVRHAKELAEKWDARVSRRSQRNNAPRSEDTPIIRRDAPESLEDLIRQKVPSKQIARMKRHPDGRPMTPEDVQEYARVHGLAIDGVAPGPPLTPAAELDQRRQAEKERLAAANERAAANAAADREARRPPRPEGAADPTDSEAARGESAEPEGPHTYAELNNLTEQVRQMVWDGVGAERIYHALRDQHSCTKAKVREIARAAKAELETTSD